VRYVAANQHPDHDTICTFRRRFLQPLSDLFVQILEIAHEMELVEVGDVAIDGSKFKAVNTRDRNYTAGKVDKRQQQIEETV
jgi:transposase